MQRLSCVLFLTAVLIGCSSNPPVSTPAVVHLVISYRPDRYVERIFRDKASAIAYIEEYKANHDYFYEEAVLEK
jgi:predicted component of type VI protein secretion system